MKKHYYLAVVIANTFLALGVQEVFGDQLPLSTFINEVANKYGVVFTVESAYLDESYSQSQLGELISFQQLPTNIDSAILALTNSLTNLTVTIDSANSKMYHIIDRRLIEMDGYAMGEVLKSIKFDGNGQDFVNYLGKAVTNLINGQHSTGAIIMLNYGTDVSIDAKEVSVRQALSKGVDLNDYKRYQGVVWNSSTSLKTRQTSVVFLGLSHQPK